MTKTAINDDTEAEATDDCTATDADETTGEGRRASRRSASMRVLAYVVLPAVALLLALAAGWVKWLDSSARDSQAARIESMHAATDSTAALLSYEPDTVEKDLGGARDRLTGNFKDSYTSLTHDVVIPGSKQKLVSAVAAVPAAASVSATENHAVVLVFVDQTVIVSNDAPTNTASSVKVTLDKIGDQWLISGFDPV
jgi:Mce-associated membrane protein